MANGKYDTSTVDFNKEQTIVLGQQRDVKHIIEAARKHSWSCQMLAEEKKKKKKKKGAQTVGMHK